MDPQDESLEAQLKMLNDQSNYTVRRNICIAVLLYFGIHSQELATNLPAPFAWDSVAATLGLK